MFFFSLTVLLCGLFPFSALAQSPFKVGFRLDYEASTMPRNDMNDFFRSYNDYYAGNIPQTFDTIAAGELSHGGWGGSIRYFGNGDKVAFQSGLVITHGSKEVFREAVFRNGITTRADWKVKDLNVQYDIGMSLYKTLTLAGHMSGRFRFSEIAIGYFYQDGSYSLGDEYDILGVYSANTTTLDFGFSAGLKIKRLYLQLGVSYPTNAFSDDGLLTLLDYDERQIRWLDIPRDYRTWAEDPANIDLETGFVRANSLRATRINFGLEFFLIN